MPSLLACKTRPSLMDRTLQNKRSPTSSTGLGTWDTKTTRPFPLHESCVKICQRLEHAKTPIRSAMRNKTRFSPPSPSQLLSWVRRYLAEQKYNFEVWSKGLDRLVPPLTLHSVGPSDFKATGEEFFDHFVNICDLKPNCKVLDVGCGTGRMARPLSKFLTTGRYEGIDIVSRSIKWCQKRYRPYPNFNFQHADIYNKAYNPNGSAKAYEFIFPFESASFDFIYLTSVFTHMLPRDVEHYTSEISRMLKPNGTCLITFFVINNESLKNIENNISFHKFSHQLEKCYVESMETPESAVAYCESDICELLERHKITIESGIRYGQWCGRVNGLSWQDIVIGRRRAS